MIKLSSCKIPNFYKGFINGHVNSAITFMMSDEELVASLLPSKLELAPQELTPEGKHPVDWSFNFLQDGVTTPVPCLSLTYNELAFVIPYVRFRDGSSKDAFAYPCKLPLNDLLALLGGRLFWQLTKVLARCSVRDDFAEGGGGEFRIQRLFGGEGPYITAEFENDGSSLPGAESANFKRLVPSLNQQLVTHGLYGYQTAAFILDLKEVVIQPLAGSLETKAFVPGFSQLNHELQSINTNLMGTFQLQVDWRLKLPHWMGF